MGDRVGDPAGVPGTGTGRAGGPRRRGGGTGRRKAPVSARVPERGAHRVEQRLSPGRLHAAPTDRVRVSEGALNQLKRLAVRPDGRGRGLRGAREGGGGRSGWAVSVL